jgi:hypothetical protein
MASFGRLVIFVYAFLIVAAGDQLRNMNLVKVAIVAYILGTVAGFYSILKGKVDFSLAGSRLIVHTVFAVALALPCILGKTKPSKV